MNGPKNNNKAVIAAFDFDGTITTKDTFIPFLFHSFGIKRVICVLLRFAPQILRLCFRLENEDTLKSSIILALFKGQPLKLLQNAGNTYSNHLLNCVRPSALQRIAWHKSQGHRLIMVSASLDVYLQHIAVKLGFDDLLCTRLSCDGDVFSGKIANGNCRSENKVKHLVNLIGHLDNYEIYAYGDSDGDKEMLDIADHAKYRTFN